MQILFITAILGIYRNKHIKKCETQNLMCVYKIQYDRNIYLLQAGVAVNAADFKGLTPLMTACMFGRAATATFLLGMGALNHLTDINGDTALHWAAYKGY